MDNLALAIVVVAILFSCQAEQAINAYSRSVKCEQVMEISK